MTRQLALMPTPEGVGSSQTAVCRLPVGYTYHSLQIYVEADVSPAAAVPVPEANWGNILDNIRVMVNGEAKIEIPAADLVSLNKFYGHSHDDGVLPIFFGRRTMRTIQGEDESAYKTNGGVASFTLELEFKGGINIGNVHIYGEQAAGNYPAGHRLAGQPMAWGTHYRLQKFSKNVAVTGVNEIADIPRGAYVVYAMHMKSGSVNSVEVYRDGKLFYNTKNAAIRDAFTKLGGRTPQAGFTHLDLDGSNRLADLMPMDAQDFRIKADFTATGAVPLYVESLQGAALASAG